MNRIALYLKKLDTIIERFPDPFDAMDPEDGDCDEAVSIAAAKLAADCLKECTLQELEIRKSIEESTKQIRKLDKLLSDKVALIRQAHREMGLGGKRHELARLENQIDEHKTALAKLEKKCREAQEVFDSCQIRNMPGEFADGALDKMEGYILQRQSAGVAVAAILISHEHRPPDPIPAPAHMNGIPIYYSSAIRKDMYVLLTPCRPF